MRRLVFVVSLVTLPSFVSYYLYRISISDTSHKNCHVSKISLCQYFEELKEHLKILLLFFFNLESNQFYSLVRKLQANIH